MLRLAVTRGPFVPMGPLVTCTMISLPGGNCFAISPGCDFFLRGRFAAMPSSASSRAASSGIMSQ